MHIDSLLLPAGRYNTAAAGYVLRGGGPADIMDRIREEYVDSGDLTEAVIRALSTTGLAVAFTAATLVAGVIMWVGMSDLRFQSDAATLLSVMLVLNALAAMVLVPAWILVFMPRFITGAARDEDGVLQTDQRQGDQVGRFTGTDKSASRYLEATIGVQPETNFHYQPPARGRWPGQSRDRNSRAAARHHDRPRARGQGDPPVEFIQAVRTHCACATARIR